jgi:hypothetical protein
MYSGGMESASFGVSHDRRDESPMAKARWFQALALEDRMELLCLFTDLALAADPPCLTAAVLNRLRDVFASSRERI